MLPYIFYLLKVTLCSGILFGYYWLLLRNKIFHHYNRFYLLAAILLSLVLPLVQITIWHSSGTSPEAIRLLQVVSSNDYLDEIVITSRQNNFTGEEALQLVYGITSFLFLVWFICMLVRIRILFIKHRHSLVENIYFVNTTAPGTPFSFFRYIFWNDHIDPESPTGNQIFKHELAHVQQKHSYDKIFINAILIFCWSNPFFWLMRKELNMIHEFIADKIAVEDSDTESFAAMILQASYPQHRFQLTSSFFYSPIKRRLIMLTKNKNPKASYIGRIMVLPLAVLVFAAFTLKNKTSVPNFSHRYDGKKITVVIDAGHGGSDNGALSLSGNVVEKDLNLSIIKKIKALSNNPNINMVFTRESDLYQSPLEKANFTEQQHADLFISVHMDAASKEKAAYLSGMSVWVAKDKYANANGSKLFASAIINEFSGDYKLPVAAHPQQQRTGIAVLQGSPCPSVLIEAGYITNTKDLAYIETDVAKNLIAGKIIAAIENYAFATQKGEAAIMMQPVETNENFPGEKTDTVPKTDADGILKALIISDGKTISQKEFRSIKPESIQSVYVYKGKEAIDKYGEKGENGVVVITMKKEFVSDKNNPESVTIEVDSTIQMNQSNGRTIIRNTKDPALLPLYVIDGKVQPDGSDLNSIDAKDIESISILKDKSSIDKYGRRAINGVVEITLKSGIEEKAIPFSDALKNNDNSTTVIRYNDGKDSTFAAYNNNNPNDLALVKAVKNTQQQPAKVFTKAEYEPEFPGGDSAWKNYLIKNLNAGLPAQEGWKPGTYKIVLTFIVKADGGVADVKADNFAGSKTAEHCIALISNGPKWKPAVQNGHLVACYKKQPVTFVVSDK